MVTSISSSNGLYEISNIKTKSDTITAADFGLIEDNSDISDFSSIFKTKEDLFGFATSLKTGSQDSFASICGHLATTQEDVSSLYQEYMQSRGCSNEEDLKILNKTNYSTMNDLKKAAENYITKLTPELSAIGIFGFDDVDWNKVLSQTSTDNIADFVNNYEKAGSCEEQMNALKSFIKNTSTQDSVDLDIQEELSELFEKLDSSLDKIKEHSEELKTETTPKENGQEKYIGSLITQYSKE